MNVNTHLPIERDEAFESGPSPTWGASASRLAIPIARKIGLFIAANSEGTVSALGLCGNVLRGRRMTAYPKSKAHAACIRAENRLAVAPLPLCTFIANNAPRHLAIGHIVANTANAHMLWLVVGNPEGPLLERVFFVVLTLSISNRQKRPCRNRCRTGSSRGYLQGPCQRPCVVTKM